MKITLKQLQVFVAAANQPTLSQAAEVCFITQSAASMALSQLEGNLGVLLFDRIGKRLRLNTDGDRLLPRAAAMLDQATELETCFTKPSGILVGKLRVGASTTIANYVLPRFLAAFKQQHPGVEFELVIHNTQCVVERIASLELDIGLIEGVCQHAKITVTPWIKDELAIICSAKHPLSQKPSVSLKDLERYSWVTREVGSGTRDIFCKALPDMGKLRSEIALSSSEAIKSYVANSSCLACLSQSTLASPVKTRGYKVLSVPRLDLTRQLYLLTHCEKHETELASAFKQFMAATQPVSA
jgi:DNA-binding transcriptional LysR family regulator